MKYFKKSLGQNFLIDKNITKKIVDLTIIKGKNIVEIGPGKGALTEELLRKNPKSLTLVEKDYELYKLLTKKYKLKKKIRIINSDILNYNFNKIKKKKIIVFGNLPYNISSQILIKFLKLKNLETKIDDLIFMFQKELGEKIIGKFPSKNYGRLSIITNFKLTIVKKFLVSANCFFPKPKVTSMVIHFKSLKKNLYGLKNISNLEKITGIIFSNKRKIIKKGVEKILNKNILSKIPDLNLSLRPEEVSPKTFYEITKLYEKN